MRSGFRMPMRPITILRAFVGQVGNRRRLQIGFRWIPEIAGDFNKPIFDRRPLPNLPYKGKSWWCPRTLIVASLWLSPSLVCPGKSSGRSPPRKKRSGKISSQTNLVIIDVYAHDKSVRSSPI